MKHLKLAMLVTTGLLTAAVAAQAQEAPAKKAGMPMPGPEVKKLAYFAGTWRSEGEIKENPMMPAGKMTSTDNCDWYQGRFHLVCRSFGKAPMGEMRSMGILGYNTEEKVYTYYGFDSMGMAEQGKGQVDGSTWTYTSESKMGDKVVQGRYTINEVSPVSYTYKYEVSEDGKIWSTVMEGKSTKIGSRPAAAAAKKP